MIGRWFCFVWLSGLIFSNESIIICSYVYMLLLLFFLLSIFFFQIGKNHGITANELFLEEFGAFEWILATHGLAGLHRLLIYRYRLIFIHVFHNGTHARHHVLGIVRVIGQEHDLVHGCVLKVVFVSLHRFAALDFLLLRHFLLLLCFHLDFGFDLHFGLRLGMWYHRSSSLHKGCRWKIRYKGYHACLLL